MASAYISRCAFDLFATVGDSAYEGASGSRIITRCLDLLLCCVVRALDAVYFTSHSSQENECIAAWTVGVRA